MGIGNWEFQAAAFQRPADDGMTRHVMIVNLRNDAATIASYRAHHQRVWPEVIESLRNAGVKRMDIHMLDRTVVMVVDLEDDADIDAVFRKHQASSLRVAEWERLMKAMQEPSPGARLGEWWAAMEPVFQLTETEPAVTS